MNKYWTGVFRKTGRGLDQMMYRCCEIEYLAPLTGQFPEHFKNADGTVSFSLKINGDKFKIEKFDGEAEEKGLYRILDYQNNPIGCKGPNTEDIIVSKDP